MQIWRSCPQKHPITHTRPTKPLSVSGSTGGTYTGKYSMLASYHLALLPPENMELLILTEPYIYTESSSRFTLGIPYPENDSSPGVVMALQANSTNISIYHPSNLSRYSAVVIMEYIKTAD